jgi:S1-C subfamily serine protease/tetratricopeptide (TPR) repeat protein
MRGQPVRNTLVRISTALLCFSLSPSAPAADWSDHLRTGTDAISRGDYAKAEKDLEQALQEAQKATKGDALLLPSLEGLGICYYKQSKLVQAESLFRRCIAIREKAQESPEDLAFDLNSLALVLQDLGKYAEAESAASRALKIMEKTSGANGVNAASVLDSLAGIYTAEGKYSDAEPLLKHALAIKEANHKDSSVVLNNLASVYVHQGNYAEAEALFKRILAYTEKTKGVAHPDVAIILVNLAEIYDHRESYVEAEALIKRALVITEKAFGPTSPEIVNCLNSLGVNCLGQGKQLEGLSLLQRALAIEERVFGPNHPDVAVILDNMAMAYSSQGNDAQAQKLFKRSNDIRQKVLGPSHANVPAILDKLATVQDREAKLPQPDVAPVVSTPEPAPSSFTDHGLFGGAPAPLPMTAGNDRGPAPAPIRATHSGVGRPDASVVTAPQLPVAEVSMTPAPEADNSSQRAESPSPNGSSNLTPSDVANIAYPSTVLIVSQDKHRQVSLGSGFFVTGTLVATNLHVVSGANKAVAKTIGDNQVVFPILGVVAIDRERDLALLSVGVYNKHWLRLGDSEKTSIGDSIFAVGNPQGLEGTFSTGIVSAKRSIGSLSLLQITAPISEGSSGGPVLNSRGDVIGISQSILRKGQNLNFAVDVSALKPLLAHAGGISPLSSLTETRQEPSHGSESPRADANVLATHVVASRNKTACSFSIENRLSGPVTNIKYVIVAVDSDGSPIDSLEDRYEGGMGTILPGLAKAVKQNLGFSDGRKIAGVQVRVLSYTPL